MSPSTAILIEISITDQITTSTMLTDQEKSQFLNLISYFTPDEIETLKALL